VLGFTPLSAAPISAGTGAVASADVPGVTGTIAATIEITAEVLGAVGVAGSITSTLDISAAAAGAHGVAGTIACELMITAAVVGVHERYELRGEVRQGGVLVNRRVRAHRRDTGALVGEGDTVAGRFQIHAGFAPAEHYIVPVHLDDAATDWSPPVANRVLSVLAQDV